MRRTQRQTDITPQQLQAAADMARKLDEFLDKCNQDNVLCLMGFDLDYLADKFEDAADKLASPKHAENG